MTILLACKLAGLQFATTVTRECECKLLNSS